MLDRVASLVHQRRHPRDPWLTPTMVELLDDWLRKTDAGLELGSGRSTHWFARRLAHLTSVEHDALWYAEVQRQLAEASLHVDYRLCPDGAGEKADSEYVGVVRSMAAASLDFVLVDGAARDHCALASIEKLRAGAILVVDNVNWFLPQREPRAPASRGIDQGPSTPEWGRFASEVASWRTIWTTDGVTDTALWVKP